MTIEALWHEAKVWKYPLVSTARAKPVPRKLQWNNCQSNAACKSGRRLRRRLVERACVVCSALFWLRGRMGSVWHFCIYSCVIISPPASCPFFWRARIAHILSFELKQFEIRRRWHCASLRCLGKSRVKWCLSADFLAIAPTQKYALFSARTGDVWIGKNIVEEKYDSWLCLMRFKALGINFTIT